MKKFTKFTKESDEDKIFYNKIENVSEQYYNFDFDENIFLQNAHIDELTIRFDFLRRDIYHEIIYYYNKNILFIYNKKQNYFKINDIILYEYRKIYCIENNKIIERIITPLIKKYFNIKNNIIIREILKHTIKVLYAYFNV
jgi:hypothetical protein